MVKPGSVVAVIPARGGSKSVPRKNLKRLAGRPLIAHSIDAALTAHSVDRVIVSTDDEEIADVARRFGAEVPFLRPTELAGDTTPDLPVFEHVLDWLDLHGGGEPDLLVHLRPTSPIRPPGCVDAAIDLLRRNAAADSVRGVVPAAQNPYKMWRLQADESLMPLLGDAGPEPYNQPRQILPATYWQTGHIDAVRTSTIRNKKSMTGGHIQALVIDPMYTCDIDSEADWLRTEWMLDRLGRAVVRPHAGGSIVPSEPQLIVFDFDGVMTDNRVWVSADGQEQVACDRGDGLGLERLRALGLEMVVLSTEKHPVVATRCVKLRLDVIQGVEDKGRRLRVLLDERRIDPAQTIYVGNDINDLECLRLVGCGVVVADAHPDVVAAADMVLTRRGGHGAVREICDLVAARVEAARQTGPATSRSRSPYTNGTPSSRELQTADLE